MLANLYLKRTKILKNNLDYSTKWTKSFITISTYYCAVQTKIPKGDFFSKHFLKSIQIFVMIFSVKKFQFFGRLFWGQISLSVCQHLVSDHELLHRRRPQQGRVVEGVELPVILVRVQMRTYNLHTNLNIFKLFL